MSLDWILEELFLSFEVTTELMQPFNDHSLDAKK